MLEKIAKLKGSSFRKLVRSQESGLRKVLRNSQYAASGASTMHLMVCTRDSRRSPRK